MGPANYFRYTIKGLPPDGINPLREQTRVIECTNYAYKHEMAHALLD